jgi:hypothetical protein
MNPLDYKDPDDYSTMPENLKDKPEEAWSHDDHRRNADNYDLVSGLSINCHHVENGLCLYPGVPREIALEFKHSLSPGDCSHFPDCTLNEYWINRNS